MIATACVVLATFNEAENIRILVPKIFQEAGEIRTHALHIVVVDDNSPDGTAEAVRELTNAHRNLHLLVGEKKGLGEACKRGIAYAIQELRADLVIQMDADLQHDPSLLPLFVTLSNSGFSLVIGSRFADGGATTNFPWYRKLTSRMGTYLVRLFGRLPALSDCTSGYRCAKADLITKCNLGSLSSRGYSFYSSLLCELVRNGARIVEVPIVFGKRTYGKSKLSFRDQTEFLTNLLRLRFGQIPQGREGPPQLWNSQAVSAQSVRQRSE